MGFSGNSNFALFTEQVDATIIRSMQPKSIYPEIVRKVSVNKGNVREYNKITSDTPISMNKVSEGSEFEASTVEFDRYVVSFDEVGTAPRLSKRTIEDAEWDQVQIFLEEIGFAAARTINNDCLEVLRAGVPTSSPDHSVAATALWSAATADPLKDLSLGLATIEANDYGDGRLYGIMHSTPMAYLRLDPNVSRVMNYGDASVLKGKSLPEIFGMKFLTTNSLTSQTGWANLANTMVLGLNADYALNYYERQPLQTEQIDVAKSRAIDVIAYMRYNFASVRPNATFQITGVYS